MLIIYYCIYHIVPALAHQFEHGLILVVVIHIIFQVVLNLVVLLGSVATFITGTLAGLLIGQSGAKDVMAAQMANKEIDAKNTQADKKLESELEINELKAEVEADAVRARLDAKPNDQMPAEQPVDTDWDKD